MAVSESLNNATKPITARQFGQSAMATAMCGIVLQLQAYQVKASHGWMMRRSHAQRGYAKTDEPQKLTAP